VAILEVFKNSQRTASYIECEDPSGDTLLEVVKNGSYEGMQHFDAELATLVRDKIVDLEVALSYASDPQQLQRLLA
jgi:twitching motility protein PilT